MHAFFVWLTCMTLGLGLLLLGLGLAYMGAGLVWSGFHGGPPIA